MLTITFLLEVSLRKETISMFDSSNYLFILANQGSGGHRLGRIISCVDTVMWYSCNENGKNPWDTFYSELITGKDISEFHYDRLVDNMVVPLVGERILKWWDNSDHLKYYQNNWQNEMKKIPVDNNKFLHWVLHDDPKSLHDVFPNAKIISLIDEDIDQITDRYMKTTAFFPVFVKLPNLKPDYKNQYALNVEKLVISYPDNLTEKHLWFYQNPNATDNDHYNYVKNMLDTKNRMRLSYDNPNHFKLTWNNLQLDLLLDFLSSRTINENYKTLIKL
jgi:hypothetical protein